MAKKHDSGVSLKTPQQIWDFYCEVGYFDKSSVEGQDAEKWITDLIPKFTEEEFETVIRNSAKSPAYAVFDETFFNMVLENVRMKKEMDEMKSVDRKTANSLDLLTQTVADTIRHSVENVVLDGIKDDISSWAEETYGPKYVTPKVYVKPNGEPIDGIVNEKFEDVCDWMIVNEPVLLTGPAGCGKNVLVEQIGQHLGMPVVVINRAQDAGELQGFKTAFGDYAVVPFIKFVRDCMEKDIEGIVVLDEIDGSDANALIAINNAIANRSITLADCSELDLHKIHFAACANTWGTGATSEYVGRNQLDAATLDRFMPEEITYDPRIEEAICPYEDLREFFQEFREALKMCGIKHVVSYRGLSAATKKFDLYKGNPTKKQKISILKSALIKNLKRDNLRNIYPNLSYSEYRDLIEELAEV